MCIMEIRAGQHTSTMVEALAHNTRTIMSDIDLLEQVLASRPGSEVCLAQVTSARRDLNRAYARFLQQFQTEVAAECAEHGHTHEEVGEERGLVEQAHHDAALARRFETR